MKTSKFFTLIVLILAAISFTACGGSKYNDAKEVYNDHITAMENFTTDMEKADDADSVAKAITNYTKAMENLIPKIKKMNKKYPELVNRDATPAELQKETERIEALSGRLESAMMKTMKYFMSPEVQAALENQGEVMSQMAE